MRTIPPNVYKFYSSAEEKLFHDFKQIDDNASVLIHSLNLPNHAYKQWAEADFVYISPNGILVLEVKGGRIGCKDGIWTFTDRNGRENRKSESPFDQAKSARFALEAMLKNELGTTIVDKFCFGFGVMFPDINFEVNSIEVPQEIVFDLALRRDGQLCKWLKNTQSYWKRHNNKNQLLTPLDISNLVKSLRPTFELVPPLTSRIDLAMNQLIRLTDDQYKYLDILVLQNRVLIEGGAGTGKTVIAIEAARRLKDSGVKIAFLCRSPVLVAHITNSLKQVEVPVYSLETFLEAHKRETLDFDVLVIDEGQDFLDMDIILSLDEIIPGGFNGGRWLYFMDRNNQGSLYGEMNLDALEYLRSAGAPWPLRVNCRNTRPIALQTYLYTGGDIGASASSAIGLNVELSEAWDDKEQEADLLAKALEKLIDDCDIKPSEVTILSPLGFDESVVSLLPRRWRGSITRIGEGFSGAWLPTSLTFCTIREFKGLENRCILLCDLDSLEFGIHGDSELYVGMTRANAYLWMSIPESGLKRFENAIKINSKNVAEVLMQWEKK